MKPPCRPGAGLRLSHRLRDLILPWQSATACCCRFTGPQAHGVLEMKKHFPKVVYALKSLLKLIISTLGRGKTTFRKWFML